MLGVTPEYREVDFDTILPSVQSGDFDIGMSVTDTDERERSVDFVTCFEAGTLWAQRSGPPIDLAHACGLRVGASPPG